MRRDGLHREILSALKAQGWRLCGGGRRHLKAIPPDRSKEIVVTSSTPSDHRALMNWLSQLRRSGFRWQQAA